jgi:hypothetical protein
MLTFPHNSLRRISGFIVSQYYNGIFVLKQGASLFDGYKKAKKLAKIMPDFAENSTSKKTIKSPVSD